MLQFEKGQQAEGQRGVGKHEVFLDRSVIRSAKQKRLTPDYAPAVELRKGQNSFVYAIIFLS